MKKNNFIPIVIALILFLIGTVGCKKEGSSNSAYSADYYVSPSGSDDSLGSFAKPFKTIAKAISVVKADELIYLRGGVYKEYFSSNLMVYIKSKNGTDGNLIKLWAYPGELPIIDGVDINGTNVRCALRMDSCSYWHLKGIDVRNVPQYVDASGIGVIVRAIWAHNVNNCIFENINSHDHQGLAFNISDNSNNNLIKNCDFYDNYDPYSWISGVKADGGNADGLHIEIAQGDVLTIDGCRMWWNSDDGMDCLHTNGTLQFNNCWAFWNGYEPRTWTHKGDGDGFKLGPHTVSNPGSIYLYNCLSFENTQCGYSRNDNTDVFYYMYNNDAYNNGTSGFEFTTDTVASIFRNNVSYGNVVQAYMNAANIHDHNSWDSSLTLSPADFLGLSSTGMDGARGSNNELPVTNFLKLSATSVLNNAGINVGLTFSGSAPNMGAY